MRIVPLIATSLLASTVSDANVTRYYAGTECEGWDFSATGYIGHTNSGCSNYTTNQPDALIVFPISGNNSNTVQYVSSYITMYDARGDDEIPCTMVNRNASGTTWYNGYLGTGYAFIGNATSGLGSLPNSGSPIANVALRQIYCYMPSSGNGYGNSFISGYQVETVNP